MTAVPSFADLGLPKELIRALARGGIDAPFPVQAAVIPDGIAGRDLLARAQTGSGKTLGFGLPLIARLAGRPTEPGRPLALVLVPTRELAMQVNDTLAPLADAMGMRMRLVAGGMPYAKQIQAIERGVHIVVATPGRLIDLMNQGVVDCSKVAVAVLDEADQMADMGFLPAMREILDETPKSGQRMLFSATLDGDVDVLIRSYLRDPALHELAPATSSVDTMDHHVLVVHPADKQQIVEQIAARDGRTIMFVRTQAGVDRITEQLAKVGVGAGGLHGGKTQGARTRTLNDFRDGITTVLVATDVAARGIHVDGIDLVVHIDAPRDPKDYLHRSGRTARAGAKGSVVTLTFPKQQREVTSLTKRAGIDPVFVRVRPGDSELVHLTGAQQPSGVPWSPPKRPSSKARAGAPRGPRSGEQRRDARGRRDARSWDTPRQSDSSRHAGKPRADKPWTDKPRADKPRGDKPWTDGPRADGPRADKPRADKPRADKPRADKPRHSTAPKAGKGGARAGGPRAAVSRSGGPARRPAKGRSV